MYESASLVYSGFFVALLPFALLLQLVSTFALGVMFYYFIGNPEKGKSILSSSMRVGARIYANTWMLAMSFLGFIGLSLVIKAFFGLFEGFAYYKSRFGLSVNNLAGEDLKIGLVVLVLAAIVYLIHWGILFAVERVTERKGTLVSKMFNAAGLFFSSLVLFSTLFIFVFAVISQSTPGAVLAWMLGILPFWIIHVVKTIWMVKMEK